MHRNPVLCRDCSYSLPGLPRPAIINSGLPAADCEEKRFMKLISLDVFSVGLSLPDPVFFYCLPFPGNYKRIVGYVLRNRSAGSCISGIADSYRGDNGIGLGSQVSQLIMLSVLNDLDHIIKERYRCKFYGRYMDDFAIFDHDKERLKEVKKFIQSYLLERGMTLNLKKTQLFKITQPLNFLGFDYHLTETGKVIMTLARKSLKRAKRRIKKQIGLPMEKEGFSAFRAHVRKGNCHHLFLQISLKRRKLYG